MRLVACPECRTQYDVTGATAETIACRCGVAIENRDLPAVDVPVSRCASCGAVAAADVRACEYCGAEILWNGPPGDLVCPECYARNPDASRFCLGCGVEFRPRPVPDSSAPPIACIRCNLPMTLRDIADVATHECPKCASLWVPGDALDALVQRVTDGANAAAGAGGARDPRFKGGNPVDQGVRYRRCPACNELMGRHNFRRVSGVVIDRCPSHGTWLDADELEEIAGFVASGGLARAAESDADESARAKRARAARVLAEHGETGVPWVRIEKLFSKLMQRPKRFV